MANSKIYEERVEPYVRACLTSRVGKEFEPRDFLVQLSSGGSHKFDLVSKDRSVIGGIKSSASYAPGSEKAAYAELYFLSLVNAEKKFLIFTNEQFFKRFEKNSAGRILPDIELLFVPLSKELEDLVALANTIAQDEVRPIL